MTQLDRIEATLLQVKKMLAPLTEVAMQREMREERRTADRLHAETQGGEDAHRVIERDYVTRVGMICEKWGRS